MALLELQTMLQNFKLDRRTMADNNTPKRIVSLTRIELDEVEESLDNPEHLKTEIADCLIFLLTLAGDYGFDMEAEIRTKIALNLLRFPSSSFQEGNYEESRLECKRKEKPIIEEFYE